MTRRGGNEGMGHRTAYIAVINEMESREFSPWKFGEYISASNGPYRDLWYHTFLAYLLFMERSLNDPLIDSETRLIAEQCRDMRKALGY